MIPPPPQRRFLSVLPGTLPYGAALTLQEELLERRRRGESDYLVLLEHPPVVTLGRRKGEEGLLLAAADYARKGIEIARCGRGGEATFHGPGQLVGYPIVDLSFLGRDLHRYLRLLEEVLIETLAVFGIPGERQAGRTGVWVGGAKIASIGVAVRHWIAWHGLALNVADALDGFATIVPCGLPGVTMTSMAGELGAPIPLEAVREALISSFANIFQSQHAGTHDPSTPEETVLA